ncbi:myosin-15 isoform X1 [Tanacetum coccineum]
MAVLIRGNPLHLLPNDSNYAFIVSLKLMGVDNYRIWASAMKLALQIKHNMGFINGTCERATYAASAPLLEQWGYNEPAMTEKILQKLKLENYQRRRSAVRLGKVPKRIHFDFERYRHTRIFNSEASSAFLSKHTAEWQLQLLPLQHIYFHLARNIYVAKEEAAAATKIQAGWRMFKIRSAFRHRQHDITTIQCLWRRKLAKRQFTKLKKEANETGALRLAKSKLEKQEDLTWRQLVKKIRKSNDEYKSLEIARLQKKVQSLALELDAAKLATVNECNKNAVLRNQLEMPLKEKSAWGRKL